MWYGGETKPKVQVSLVPDPPSPCMGSINTSPLSINYQLTKGQFIVWHIRPYYGSLLPWTT